MTLEFEPQETKVSCEEARSFILERLQHKFDDILVVDNSPEFQEAVEVGNHASSCPTKICQFLGLTLHTRNSGTEIDLEATREKLGQLLEEEQSS